MTCRQRLSEQRNAHECDEYSAGQNKTVNVCPECQEAHQSTTSKQHTCSYSAGAVQGVTYNMSHRILTHGLKLIIQRE